MKNGCYGHATDDARTAFCEAVEDYANAIGKDRRCVLPSGHRKAISGLWNCTDILPGDVWAAVLELTEILGAAPPRRSTYGAAARAICS